LKIVEKDMSGIATTMQIFIRRASLWLINSSSVGTLVELVSSSSGPPASRSKKGSKQAKSNGNSNDDYHWEVKMADQAQRILVYISKHCAALYYGHLALLAKEVHAASTPASLETSLRALAAVACLGTDQSPVDRSVLPMSFVFIDLIVLNIQQT
jgi:sister-chromatid-cohesion protein PDS5